MPPHIASNQGLLVSFTPAGVWDSVRHSSTQGVRPAFPWQWGDPYLLQAERLQAALAVMGRFSSRGDSLSPGITSAVGLGWVCASQLATAVPVPPCSTETVTQHLPSPATAPGTWAQRTVISIPGQGHPTVDPKPLQHPEVLCPPKHCPRAAGGCPWPGLPWPNVNCYYLHGELPGEHTPPPRAVSCTGTGAALHRAMASTEGWCWAPSGDSEGTGGTREQG